MRISDSLREPGRPRLRLLGFGLALVLLTIATRLPLLRLDRPIDDEVVYGVVAQTIVDGGVPYVSAVERKPPLLFYVYAAVLRAFGSYNWRALHLVEVAWILSTMGGLFVIGRRLFDQNTGLIAALLYSIFQAWSYWNNLAFNGEVLMNLPIVWAYALGFSKQRSSRILSLRGAGGLCAVGFLLKQPAPIALVPLALYVTAPSYRLARRHTVNDSLGHLFSLFVGFSVVLIAAASWLISRGLFGDALYWTITNHAVPQVYWEKGLENTLAFTAFCLPITAGAWLSSRATELWQEKRSERNALIALVVASLIGAGSSGRFYPHYYIAVIPPCALLAAPWLARAWRASGRDRRVRHLSQAWLAATVIVFAVAHVRGLSRQPTVSEAGQYLMSHSSEQDRIFVWGQTTRIYVDAHRRPASRYVATFPLTGLIFGAPRRSAGEPKIDTRARIVPGAWDKLLDDFARHKPAFIVDTEASRDASYPVNQFPALEQLLATEYEPVAQTADGVIYKTRRVEKDATRRAASTIDREPFEPFEAMCGSAHGAHLSAFSRSRTAGFPSISSVFNRPAGTAVARPMHVQTTATSVPVLDGSVLGELRTLGADVVAEIFDLFVSDVPHRLARLQHAIDDRSRDGVLHEAHGLKGSALALGAARFAGLCAAIERDAREGHLNQASARSSTLQTEFSEVRRAMKEMGLARDPST